MTFQRTRDRLLTSPIVMPAVLGLFVFLLNLPTLWFNFVWDDLSFVKYNQSVRSARYILKYFGDPYTFAVNPSHKGLTAWRPLRNISYLVDYQLNGLNPAGYHLHNVLLQVIGAVVLYFLFKRILTLATGLRENPFLHFTAWIAAALWAAHPVQTEVVAWIKSRDDLMVDLFIFASLHCCLSVLFGTRRKTAFLFAILFLILGGLSKDNAIVLPAFAALLALLSDHPLRFIKTRRYLLLIGTLLLVSLAIMMIRGILVGKIEQSGYLTGGFYSMMLTMIPACWRYARLIAWPFPPTYFLSDYYAYPMEYSIFSLRVLWSAAGVAIFLAILAIGARRKKAAWLGILFFLLAMLPYMNLVPMVQVMAERFLVLPIVGIALFFAAVLLSIQTPAKRKLAAALCLLLLGGYSTANVIRQRVWRNNLALSHDIYYKNTNLRTTLNYAGALYKSGLTTESLKIASDALHYVPASKDLRMLVGLDLVKLGQTTRGLAMARKVYEEDPNKSETAFSMVEGYFLAHDYGQAKKLLDTLSTRFPKSDYVWYNLGVANCRLGDKQGALRAYRMCVKIAPFTNDLDALRKQIDSLP